MMVVSVSARHEITNGHRDDEDEQGIEAFYTLGLGKSFRLTGNVQIVDSAISNRDIGVTAGLRLTTIF